MSPQHIATTAVLCWTVLTIPALGQQVTFVRNTDTILVPGNTAIASTMTIEARVAVQGAGSGYFFQEQMNAAEDKAMALYLAGLGGAAWRGVAYSGFSVNFTWTLCEWTHVAFVVEGNAERIYVDGALIGSRTVPGTIQNSAQSAMSVGAFMPLVGGLRDSVRGSIDWMRVSSVARYSGSSATPPSSEPASDAATLLLYHFNEPAGSTTVIDQGPNGWNGTLGAWFAGATSPVLGPLVTIATSYCTPGTSASGCQATLSTSGAASASAGAGFVLAAGGVEGDKDGLFFFGTNGQQANSWGNGTSFQCVVPPVKRAGVLAGNGASGTCAGALSQDFNTLWSTKPSKNPGAGALVQAQLWYRDPANTSNQTTSLSSAIEFAVCP
jgi:hypothetical protein